MSSYLFIGKKEHIFDWAPVSLFSLLLRWSHHYPSLRDMSFYAMFENHVLHMHQATPLYFIWSAVL